MNSEAKAYPIGKSSNWWDNEPHSMSSTTNKAMAKLIPSPKITWILGCHNVCFRIVAALFKKSKW